MFVRFAEQVTTAGSYSNGIGEKNRQNSELCLRVGVILK